MNPYGVPPVAKQKNKGLIALLIGLPLLLILVSVSLWYIYTNAKDPVAEEGKRMARRYVLDICESYDPTTILRLASSELRSKSPRKDVEKWAKDRRDYLGPVMRAYEPRLLKQSAIYTSIGPEPVLMFRVRCEFEKRDGEALITLLKREGDWQMLSFDADVQTGRISETMMKKSKVLEQQAKKGRKPTR